MARSVADFLAQATADNIRSTNTFEIEATSGYADVDAVLDKMMIYGQNITIPERGIEYSPVSFKGYEIPNLVPVRMTMGNEHSMSVLADIDGTNRRVFLRWMNHVMDADLAGGSLF